MGYDNAAFAIFLAGCNSSSAFNVTDYQRCYQQVDLGNSRKDLKRIFRKQIEAADPALYAWMIHPSILPHIAPVKQSLFQSYFTKNAKFVLHLPSQRADKFALLTRVLEWNAYQLDQLVL
jgi:hypothetical protein